MCLAPTLHVFMNNNRMHAEVSCIGEATSHDLVYCVDRLAQVNNLVSMLLELKV